MITLNDYWMGRQHTFKADLTEDIIRNATVTIKRANMLLTKFKSATNDTEQRKVTSGWRPPKVNAGVPNAAVRSKHMTGQAIDIADPEGDLDEWCMTNQAVLEEVQLWLEHPSATKGWCHLQTIPPKSGRRVFYP